MATDEITGNATLVGTTNAPSLVPDQPIDLDHLAGVSKGDPGTMREMLKLFNLQADVLVARMSSEVPRTAAARAHTLAACARSIGAWRVAENATTFEQAALASGPIVLNPAMRGLSQAVTEVQVAIGSFLSEIAQ